MSSTKNRLHKTFGIDVAAHGDLSGIKLDPNVELEVIVLAHSRTGTTSVQKALTMLGVGPSHQAIDLFRSRERTEAFIEIFDKILQGTWRAGDAVMTKRLRDLMRGYRSTTDHPINYLSDEIYAAYPDARYILMTRPDGAEGWWKSVTEATGWHMRDDGNWCGLWRARYGGVWGPSLYDAHNEHIRQLVPRAQLLEHDVRDGWGPLAGFLEVPVPAEPYPRLNETSAMRAIYFGMMAYGACAWLLYAGAAASAVYLAAKPGLARSIALRAVEFLSSVPARVGSK